MRKRLMCALLCLMCLMPVWADAEPIVLRFAHTEAPESLWEACAACFIEQAEAITAGDVTFRDANAKIVSAEDALQSMLAGNVGADAAYLPVSALTVYGCEQLERLLLPDAFESREAFWQMVTGKQAGTLLREPIGIGLPLIGLTLGEDGRRHIALDADGKRLEGTLGALSAKDISAVSEDGIGFDVWMLVLTDHAWNSLTSEQQKALVTAAERARTMNASLAEGEEAKARQALEAAGVMFLPAEELHFKEGK